MIRYRIAPAREQRPVGTRPFHSYVLDNGELWTEFHRVQPGYLLRFPGLADFSVSGDGTAVVAYPARGTDAGTLEHLYLNQVIPLATSRQGRPAFHASVVAVPGGCAAFLGPSGIGKSTLAASFALAGQAFLGDDALIIDESRGAVFARPADASIRLWEDSLSALTGDERRHLGRTSYSPKARLFAGGSLAHDDRPRPIRAGYLLRPAEGERVVIRRLSGADRHMAWLRNSFVLDIEDRALLSRHLEWTRRVAAAVPTFGLGYVRDFGALEDVKESILEHVAGLDPAGT